MQRREFLWATAAVALPVALRAADVSGAWESETESPMGYSRTLYQLSVADGKVGGTIFNDRTGEAKIAGGKVDGDKIEFTVEMSRGQRTFTMLFKGKVDGNEMQLTREFQMPEGGPQGGGPGGGRGPGGPGGGPGGPGGGAGGPGGGQRGGGMGRGPQEVFATRVDEQGLMAWEDVKKQYAANPPQQPGGGGRRRGPQE